MEPPLLRTATYRLQFNRHFTLKDAAALADYLAELGISHVYASPLLAARPGSLHGYDVVDHATLNPELGTEEDLERLAVQLRSRGMGLIVDTVPNHMCIASPANRWWTDVLENGPSSPFAPFFDIDWQPPKRELAEKVLLPFLGDQYGRVLDNQEIRVEFASGAFLIRYHDHEFPLAPKPWTSILKPCLERARRALSDRHADVQELESILSALDHLPPRSATDPEQVRERVREKEVVKRRLATLADRSPAVREAIEESVRELNGRRGDPASFDRLDRLLGDQAYRLSYWRVASDEINYRRFFDVNEFAALRVERPEVFDATHAAIRRWIARGWVQGLRIDHVDGLHDPLQYLVAVRAACGPSLACLLVEKIVGHDERLRPGWPIDGTTGYGFVNLVNGVFVDPAGERALRRAYERLAGGGGDFAELAYVCKKLILSVSLASEHHVLSRKLDRISEQHRWSRDFTFNSLAQALAEVIACFPVYRTYTRPDEGAVDPEDRRHIESAVAEARRRNPSVSASTFEFIRSVLLLDDPDGLVEAERAERRTFVMAFQQLTPPVMAKAVEDTAFYRHFPLASLNEVGGDPSSFGVTPDLFHRRNEERLRLFPRAMISTGTHDTKRGEDVRCRLNALSEIPREWEAAVRRWRRMNRALRTTIEGAAVPDANEEYLFYQTVLGACAGPMAEAGFAPRIDAYMTKALREAKVHTSWINANEAYEKAVSVFVHAALDSRTFRESLDAFLAPVVRAGRLTSIAQCLLKIGSPGIPDFYQGSETWDLRLVDPDNRTPVDFATRRALLESIRDGACTPAELLAKPEDGRLKLFVTQRALACRRSHPGLFELGSYEAIAPRGPRADHAIAFARVLPEGAAIVAVARFFLKMGEGDWGATSLTLPDALAPAEWRDVFTGRRVRASGGALSVPEVFSVLPVALLERLP